MTNALNNKLLKINLEDKESISKYISSKVFSIFILFIFLEYKLICSSIKVFKLTFLILSLELTDSKITSIISALFWIISLISS